MTIGPLLWKLHTRVELRNSHRVSVSPYARSLRQAAFGYSMTNRGGCVSAMLPPAKEIRYRCRRRTDGAIMYAYLHWKLSGDEAWLKMWPRVKKGLEFAWVPGGSDANRDGV